MKKRTLVSLGMSCQTAHQLARLAANNPDIAAFQKGPFDWLICPGKSASKWLDANLVDFSQNELSITRDHAYWQKFNFWFWHGFYTKTQDQRLIDIAANTSRELKKLIYQREQFQGLNPKTTLFIVSNTQNNLLGDVFQQGEENLFHFTNDNIIELQSSLENFFHSPVTLKVITRPDRADQTLLTNPNTLILPVETSEWKGADSDWDKILVSLCKN